MKERTNTLLGRKTIENRLKILKDGYASCAIEGLHITKEDRTFMEGMVHSGLNPEEMIRKIKKRMAI